MQTSWNTILVRNEPFDNVFGYDRLKVPSIALFVKTGSLKTFSCFCKLIVILIYGLTLVVIMLTESKHIYFITNYTNDMVHQVI